MGQTSRSMEDSGTEINVDYESLGQEASEEMNINKWPRDCSCDMLVKNVAVFYIWPNNLSEAKLKSFGLTALAEEISRQPGIDQLGVIDWLGQGAGQVRKRRLGNSFLKMENTSGEIAHDFWTC